MVYIIYVLLQVIYLLFVRGRCDAREHKKGFVKLFDMLKFGNQRHMVYFASTELFWSHTLALLPKKTLTRHDVLLLQLRQEIVILSGK